MDRGNWSQNGVQVTKEKRERRRVRWEHWEEGRRERPRAARRVLLEVRAGRWGPGTPLSHRDAQEPGGGQQPQLSARNKGHGAGRGRLRAAPEPMSGAGAGARPAPPCSDQ